MFGKSKTQEIDRLLTETKELQTQKRQLKEQVEELKLAKKISEEDIKHMIRIKEKRLELEFKEKTMDTQAAQATAIAAAKSEYQDKLIKNVEREKDDIKEMYGQILERLPNIGVKMKGSV